MPDSCSYIKPPMALYAPEDLRQHDGNDDVQRRSLRKNARRRNSGFPRTTWTCATPNMARAEAREKVIPTYMGLSKPDRRQIGVLEPILEQGAARHHMIVSRRTWRYIGDTGGRKRICFTDQSEKITLIVIDPSER